MIHADHPAAGTYSRRFARGEPLRAVLIEDRTERDPETGEPMEDERFVAFVDGEETPVDRVWPAQPIDRDEYERILHANRTAIGANHPPAASLLEQAAEIAEGAAFITGTAEKIDTVKRITGLVDELKAEQLEACKGPKLALMEAGKPYDEAMRQLLDTKEAVLADLHKQRLPGETLKGRYASAFGRKVQKVVIDNPSVVPRLFCRPDETLIKAALKAGQVVPGCRLDTTEATTVS